MRLIFDNFLHCCLMRTTLLEIQAHKWQGQVGATAFMLLSMFCKAYASSTTTRTKCGILHPFWQRIEHGKLEVIFQASSQGKRCDCYLRKGGFRFIKLS